MLAEQWRLGLRTLALAMVLGITSQRPERVARLERLVTITKVRDTELDEMYVTDLAIDPASNLYLLQRASGVVLKLDSTGKEVGRTGRRGRGPGEFADPGGIAVDSQGRVAVLDHGKRTLVVFGPGLTFESEITVAGVGFPARLLAFAGDSAVLLVSTGEDVGLAAVGKGRSSFIRRFPAPPKRPVPAMERCRVRETRAALLSPELAVGAASGVIAFNADGSDQVQILGPRGQHRVLAAGLPRLRGTAALAKAELGDSIRIEVRGVPCSVPISEIGKQAGIADVTAALRSLLVGVDGRVWAIGFGSERPLRLLEVGGTWNIEGLPREGRLAAVGTDRVIVLEDTAEGAPAVVVYRLRK